jgi:hypothetical protein
MGIVNGRVAKLEKRLNNEGVKMQQKILSNCCLLTQIDMNHREKATNILTLN